MTCSNKTKQLGLAFQNYHDTYQAFPAGAAKMKGLDATAGENCSFNGFVAILPYIEQTSIYDVVVNAGYGYTWRTNLNLTETDVSKDARVALIDAFQCPSDPNANKRYGGIGTRSYRLNWGDYPTFGAISSDNLTYCTTGRGVFSPMTWQNMGAITDGTSNTILTSERAVSSASGDNVEYNIRSTFIYNSANYIDPTKDVPANIVLASKGWNYDSAATTATIKVRGMRSLWGGGGVTQAGFQTILQPNAKCTDAPGQNEFSTSIHCSLIVPSSYHPGGVHTGFADGSVRFVPDTVDNGGFTLGGGISVANPTASPVVKGMKLSGESDFGVWGALGSINGGESKSL